MAERAEVFIENGCVFVTKGNASMSFALIDAALLCDDLKREISRYAVDCIDLAHEQVSPFIIRAEIENAY